MLKRKPTRGHYLYLKIRPPLNRDKALMVYFLTQPAADRMARPPPLPARGVPATEHLFCPRRMAFSSLPYLFLIHLIPCSWASTMRGQRSVLHRMVAFSVDMRSLGSPWLFQVATSASSVSRLKGSRPSVMGMGTCSGRMSSLRRDGVARLLHGNVTQRPVALRQVVASQAPCDKTAVRLSAPP